MAYLPIELALEPEDTTVVGDIDAFIEPIVRQKFIGLIQNRLWASLVHISMWSKGS